MHDYLMLERHGGWKYPGAYAQQPVFDLAVYAVIRAKLAELRKPHGT